MESTKEASFIQRVEMLEEKLGIKLSGVNVKVMELAETHHMVSIMGEITANNGESIPHPITIKASVFDKSGKVIGTGDQSLDNESFYAIDTLNITAYTETKNIGFVKVFPVKD